jgi:hypothetical protein
MDEIGPAGLCYLVVLVFLLAGIVYAVGKAVFGG